MTVLVLGATGATGILLVQQLLNRDHKVKAVVRDPAKIHANLVSDNNLTVIRACILDLADSDMLELTKYCDAVVSCLGHNLNFKGLYGKPRKLVTDAARRICGAITSNNPTKPVKYVLMNTAGNSNRDINESVSTGQKIVTGIIRILLPPHSDNEQASDYLREKVGQNNKAVEWSVVRPDSLIDENNISKYNVYPSPIRSPIFDPGKTSRINVAHFMAELVSSHDLWNKWKGQMPVIYNAE